MKTLAQLNQYSTSSVVFTDEALGAGQVLANRYQINGLLDTAVPVLENIEKLCNASGSWLSYDIHEGKWGVVINQSGTSIVSFNDSNIIGNITVSGTGLQDLYNSVKVEFPHRELRDSADFITIEIPDGDRNPNEFDTTLNISYDVINEPVQADLLGFIELKQSRVDLVIKFAVDFSYINLKAGDIIDVTDSRFAFSNKLFRIVTITEVQDDEGPLLMEIIALEYDANVYSTADLFRYTRTDENGIVTIGSIGVPGTPQVTKYEVDARPRVIIESTAPTGVVEGLEYWLTNDVSEIQDDNRSYTLIATKRPIGGGIYNSGDTVSLDYDQLGTSNFYVKTRGFNATTVGPYSNPSGLAIFTATQLTDAIGPNTKALDALGTIGTLLGVYSLLKGVDELYQKIANTGSLFTKIFETLKDETGIDLTSPEASVGVPVTVRDEGNLLTTSTRQLNFVGGGVVATASGDNVTVQIAGGSGGVPNITEITPNYSPTTGGTSVVITGTNFSGATGVTFDGLTATNFLLVSDTTITATTPANTEGPANVVVQAFFPSNAFSNFTYLNTATGYLNIIERLPPDRNTFQDPTDGVSSDTAPITGSYFARYGGRPFYGPITVGTGTIKLYKSDGSLVETLNPSDLIITNEVVEFPFANRTLGTDYYILIDEGVLTYCNLKSREISQPTQWGFNTPLWENTAYSMVSTGTSIFTASTTILDILPNGIACPNADLEIQFNRSVGIGSGNVYVKRLSDNVADLTIAVSSATATVNGDRMNLGGISSLSFGQTYYVEAEQGIALGLGDCFASTSSRSAALTGTAQRFTMTNQLLLSSFVVDSDPLTSTTTNVNPQTNIGLVFNKTPSFGESGVISLYKSNGSLHQNFDVETTFAADGTNEIIWISTSTVWLNPTVDLEIGQTYYVQATVGSITDSCNVQWAGISDTTTVRFTVDAGPSSTSTALTTASTRIELNFDRAIEPGSGSLNIYDQNNNLISSIDSDDPAIGYE